MVPRRRASVPRVSSKKSAHRFGCAFEPRATKEEIIESLDVAIMVNEGMARSARTIDAFDAKTG